MFQTFFKLPFGYRVATIIFFGLAVFSIMLGASVTFASWSYSTLVGALLIAFGLCILTGTIKSIYETLTPLSEKKESLTESETGLRLIESYSLQFAPDENVSIKALKATFAFRIGFLLAKLKEVHEIPPGESTEHLREALMLDLGNEFSAALNVLSSVPDDIDEIFVSSYLDLIPIGVDYHRKLAKGAPFSFDVEPYVFSVENILLSLRNSFSEIGEPKSRAPGKRKA